LEKQLEPLEKPMGKLGEIHVHVQIADGNLMFHKPSIYGIGDRSFLYIAGKRGKPSQVLRQCEYIFAADKTEIVNDRRWPRNYLERQTNDEFFASAILIDPETDTPLWDRIEYLVLVCIKVYHENNGDSVNKCGEVLKRIVDITIYKEPEIGFKRLFAESVLADHVHLTDSVLYKAMNQNNLDVVRLMGRLDEICERFQTHVYAHGLKDMINRSENTLMSGQFGPVTMYYSPNRGRSIEIRNPCAYMLLGISKNGERLDVVSQSGTIPQIRSMIDGLINEWENNPLSHGFLQPDR